MGQNLRRVRHKHLGRDIHSIHVRSREQGVGKSLNYQGNRRFPTFRRCSAPRSGPIGLTRPSPHPARRRYGRSHGHRIRRPRLRSPQNDAISVQHLFVPVSFVTWIEVWSIDFRPNGWRATRIPAASSRFPTHRTAFCDRTALQEQDPSAVGNTTPAAPHGSCPLFLRRSCSGPRESTSRSRTSSLFHLHSSISSSFGPQESTGGYPNRRLTSRYSRMRYNFTIWRQIQFANMWTSVAVATARWIASERIFAMTADDTESVPTARMADCAARTELTRAPVLIQNLVAAPKRQVPDGASPVQYGPGPISGRCPPLRPARRSRKGRCRRSPSPESSKRSASRA